MEQPRGHANTEHVIDMRGGGEVCSSGSSRENPSHGVNLPDRENNGMRNSRAPVIQSSPSFPNGPRTAEPSVYRVLISIKLTYKMSLIIASTIVLLAARHERPRNPLFSWIVGHTAGCAASLPIIFRHFFLSHPRLCRLVDHFKLILELFFATWFVVGNYWIFTETSSSQAQNLYRLCIVLLVFNYIKYIGPFILRATVLCCCRSLLDQISGAPTESINALPTYKFKLHKNGSVDHGEIDEKMHEGGIVAEGTEKERVLLGDDAVCCICLASYNDDEVLKELPCSHFFHASCVDTWLKIKAFCPLCKCIVGKSTGELPSAASSSQQV